MKFIEATVSVFVFFAIASAYTATLSEEEILQDIEALAMRELETESMTEIQDGADAISTDKLDVDDDFKIEPIPIPYPIRPIPKNPETCCHPGTTYVDLVRGNVCSINNAAVTVELAPTTQGSFTNRCNKKAVLKINFEKITSSPCDLADGCLYGPYCGRRMLRIDLELSAQNRTGYLFNVGDSVSNDGFKGDAGDQQNDAEIMGVHPHVATYSSDLCTTTALRTLATHLNAIKTGLVSHVTLYISDKHVRITNDNGLDETLCHKCLFALNGQPDNQTNGPNQDIYLALNRVIYSNSNRIGAGVCAARLSWMCPW